MHSGSRRLVFVVEGHGEETAVPVLVRRVAALVRGEASAFPEIDGRSTLRVPRSKLLREGELERTVEFAFRKGGEDCAVLVLLDSDDDLPCELGPKLQQRVDKVRPGRLVSVVLAEKEFESWFLPSIAVLAIHTQEVRSDVEPPPRPESIRDAKGWLSKVMNTRYRETVHQERFAAAIQIDLPKERDLRSLAKLRREVDRLLRV